jgi:hypothetical protein
MNKVNAEEIVTRVLIPRTIGNKGKFSLLFR